LRGEVNVPHPAGAYFGDIGKISYRHGHRNLSAEIRELTCLEKSVALFYNNGRELANINDWLAVGNLQAGHDLKLKEKWNS
jgi:hypothetical protein